jgi:HPt (histidine-containing phosphotransfer) domain-containing protein
MPDAPPFEEAALEQLQKLGGDSFVHEMVRMFYGYSDEKLAAAREALTGGNLDGVEKAIHPLKTSAGHVGAAAMKEISQQIEQFSRNGEETTIPDLLTALEQAYSEVKPLLEAKLKDYPA